MRSKSIEKCNWIPNHSFSFDIPARMSGVKNIGVENWYSKIKVQLKHQTACGDLQSSLLEQKKNELAYLVRATDADPNVLHIGGNLVKLKGTKVFFLSPECMRWCDLCHHLVRAAHTEKSHTWKVICSQFAFGRETCGNCEGRRWKINFLPRFTFGFYFLALIATGDHRSWPEEGQKGKTSSGRKKNWKQFDMRKKSVFFFTPRNFPQDITKRKE